MARLPLVSPLDRALFLKVQPYLEGLSPRVLAALAQYGEERAFHRDEVIYAAGRPPDRVYFLASGRVRTRYPDAEPYDIAAPGGIGLVEWLAESARPPEVHALEETFTLAVEIPTLLQLMEDEFVLYAALTRGLSRAGLEELQAAGAARRREPGFPETAQGATFATLDLVHRIARARQSPFFRDSSLTVMTQLLRFQEPRHLGSGEALWRRGSEPSSLALVLDGTLASTDAGTETLQPAGALLGGWELFSSGARCETVVARAPARVIEIDRTLFTDVLEDHFGFARDFLAGLCRRVIELRYGPQPRRGSEGGAPAADQRAE